jgi:hypothetical protein
MLGLPTAAECARAISQKAEKFAPALLHDPPTEEIDLESSTLRRPRFNLS